jgi:heme/copper-type cytochrome/quinol oxidase subunit 3
MVCIGVHCVVFTYFIATAKWVQHAIAAKQLDASLAEPTKSFKRQAFPAALLAMASVFAAAVLGAARDNQMTPTLWHHAAAVLAVVVNLIVAVTEYRAIVYNGRLIDSILARINGPADSDLAPAAVAANMRS